MPERWAQIELLYHAALEREPSGRAVFLDEACAGDDDLRREVASLLAYEGQPASFIEAPVLEVAARELADESLSAAENYQPANAPSQIGAYQILSLLGRGGMGEVWLAHDPRLGRKVAVKLLPAEFTQDAERVRRFEQEARAASALNHPNIITIHEIGEIDGTHYLVTEFIDGETLRQRIARSPMELNEALDTAVQVAGALAEAHAAGIMHRDIKPENIMLRRDGLVKVLDFGLAKLTGRVITADNRVPTQSLIHTEPGLIIGTVQYMSPEQLRGLATDARTDIWSLGVVLYEMLARRTPFKGETMSDCIALILERPPVPLASYFEGTPAALERLVAKALAKDRDDRYQTSGEMLTDLRRLKQRLEIAAELERAPSAAGAEEALTTNEERALLVERKLLAQRTGEAQATQTATGKESLTGKIRSYRKGLLVAFTASALVIAGIGLVLYRVSFKDRPLSPLASSQTMTISRLPSIGKPTNAAISPDGKYVVYVTSRAGGQSLRLIHVATGSDKEIVPPAESGYRGLIFSHDSNYVYFVGSSNDKADDGLYKITVFGGDRRKLSGNVGSSASQITKVHSIALAPDDQRVAFARRVEGSGESALIVMKTDGTGERKLLTRGMAERVGEPSWSSNGKTIVCSILNINDGFSFKLIEVNVEDGKERQLSSQKWWYVGRLAWLREGSGFVMTASDRDFGLSQVWFVSYPEGTPKQITNDLNVYDNVSLTADSSIIVAVQRNPQLNLSIAPNGDAGRARQIISGDNTVWEPSWTPDNRIVYNSMASGKRVVYIIDADGENRKQLNDAADASIAPSMTRDGRYIVFTASIAGALNIWRMDADGGNLKQLTEDGGVQPGLTPDGKWVVYSKLTATGQIRRVPVDGGASIPVTGENVNAMVPMVSPDGKWIACHYSSPQYRSATLATGFRTAVIPFEGGEPIRVFDLLGGPEDDFGWTSDSRALTYISRGGVSNIWIQPLDGSRPKQVTDFKSDQIRAFDWSHDGRQLLVLRATPSSDIVKLTDFK
jgi:serine/threonine protein kinase/Tol biopolymer transport system component